jgi:hypothetical protein
MDAFARVCAGVTSPAEFFSDENAEHILAMATEQQLQAENDRTQRKSS